MDDGCFVIGDNDGDTDGSLLGEIDGSDVCPVTVGAIVTGFCVGDVLGSDDGEFDGTLVGETDG